MNTLDLQILLGGPTAYVMVRFASLMTSDGKLWRLAVFLTAVFLANLFLMTDRFELQNAIYRASMITGGYFAGVIFMAYVWKREERKKARAEDLNGHQ